MNDDDTINQTNNVTSDSVKSDTETKSIKDHMLFYHLNYDVIAKCICNNQDNGHKTYVDQGKPAPFTCRFCGKTAPEVSFRNTAHALSELIGNKSIFLKCECDSCNKRFGKIYENQLANFLGPNRTLSYTKGKNGVPSYKTSDGKLRIDVNDNMVVIQEASDSNLINSVNGDFTVTLQKNKYIPILVFKSFIVMALSIIPEEELPAFKQTISWLNSDQDDSPEFLCNASYASHVVERFIDGIKPLQVRAWVFRRKSGKKCPYAFFVLEFDNYFYQIPIPCLDQDKDLANMHVRLPIFPSTIDVYPKSEDMKLRIREINLSSLEPVIGEPAEFTLSYDFIEKLYVDSATLNSIVSEKGIKPLDGSVNNTKTNNTIKPSEHSNGDSTNHSHSKTD